MVTTSHSASVMARRLFGAGSAFSGPLVHVFGELLMRNRDSIAAFPGVPAPAYQLVFGHVMDDLTWDHTSMAFCVGTNTGDEGWPVHAIRQYNPRCVTILLTGYPALETSVQAIHDLCTEEEWQKPASEGRETEFAGYNRHS